MKKIRILNCIILLSIVLRLQAKDTYWQCDMYNYQYDMTMYPELYVDGQIVKASGGYELAAFCGDECRGVASVETIESTGKTYYYLRVRSNVSDNETVTFKCYDRAKQCELELDTTIGFESQSIKGFPSEPFVLVGAYKYKVEYFVDREVVKTDSVKYGAAITLPEEPTKEGYTFSGWSEVPATMPAKDVTVSGTFIINKYLVTFKIGDVVIAADSLEYGASIVAPEVHVKEGHTFDGWGDVAETVPASDLTYEGSYTVNSYLLTYMVDGEVVEADSVVYGTAITAIAEPTKEGYTFSGWSEVPATMPADDVIISGTFTINQYTVTFVIDGEVFATDTITYGEKIILPDVPVKDGYDFAWNDEIPETMPAEDIVINGSYTTGVIGVELNEEVLYIYSIDGKCLDELRKGINVVLMKDGRIRKVMKK